MAVVTVSPAFGVVKTPRFNTIAQETAAIQGSVYVAAAQYPVWDFKLTIPYITGRIDDPSSVIAQLLALFLAAKGRAGTFVFQDPNDYMVTAYPFATGDGSSIAFQLLRPIGTQQDIVQNVNGTPVISINGVPTTLFSIDDHGIVTFNSPPTLGAVITWTGTFNFLLRFTDDSFQDLTGILNDSWFINTFNLVSVIR